MTRAHRWTLLLACGLTPTVAHASDFSGVVTILFGVPGVLIACLVAAGVVAVRPSGRQKILAAVVFLPVLTTGMGILIVDTTQMLSRGLMDDLVFATGYIALLILLAALVARIFFRPLAPEALGDKPSV